MALFPRKCLKDYAYNLSLYFTERLRVPDCAKTPSAVDTENIVGIMFYRLSVDQNVAEEISFQERLLSYSVVSHVSGFGKYKCHITSLTKAKQNILDSTEMILKETFYWTIIIIP
jgi:hypothetical protein